MHTTTHRWRRLLAILFAFALLAAACGSDDSGETADEDSSATDTDDASSSPDEGSDDDAMEDDEPEPTPEPVEIDQSTVISEECAIPDPGDEVEIDVMGWEFPIISAYAEEFEECEDGNYSFNFQFLDSTAAREQMTLDAATGDPEFELYQGSNSFIIELANAGSLIPLNDLIAQYGDQFGLDEISQNAWDTVTLDGNIYAIPGVTNTMHLFYNAPEMERLGLSVPTTFEEAFAACEAIQADGYDVGFMYMLSAGWSWQIEFDSVLGSLGVTPVDPVTGAPNFNSDEGIQAAELLQQMNDECGGAAASTYSTDDIQAAFQTGEVILGHTWASRAAAMDDEEASTVVGQIEFAPALSTVGDTIAAPAYTDGWGIPTGTDPDMIEAIFLAIMAGTDRESQEAASKEGFVTRDGIVHPEGPRNAAAVAAGLSDGKGPDLVHPAAGIARAKLGEALITILDGTSPADALAAAEEAYLAEAGDQGLLDGGDAPAPAAGFDSVISEECAIPDPGDEVEIDVMGWEFPIISAYAEEFEECEDGNYSFNFQFLDSTAAREQMTLDAATGDPEFELYQGSNSFIIELANAGSLIPLNDLIAQYGDQFGLDEISQNAWDTVTLDGNIYAIPGVTNTMHLFYNAPEMERLGLSVPTTFEEAFAACEAIQADGYDVGFMYMLSAGWSWQIEFDSVLGSLGVTPVDPVTGAPNFNSDEGIQAAELLQQMNDECGGAAASTYSTDDIQAAFQTGEVILGHTWASRAAAMDDEEASTVVGQIEFAPALSTVGDTIAAPAYTDGWGIPTGTDPDMIEAIFLAIMAGTDRESQEAASKEGFVTRDGIVHPEGPRNAAAVAAGLSDGKGPDLVHPAAGIARAKLGEALITILDGTSPADALAAAEEAYLAEAGDQGLLG